MSSENTILVIEDEISIRTMIRYTLENEKFIVCEAGDAHEADAIISVQKPDLILLDWMLPKITGIAFTRRLKNNPSTEDIPIILLTAKAEEENKVMGLESGADDYIVKPFSPRELVARIHAVLRRAAAGMAKPSNELMARDLIVDTRGQRCSIQGEPIKLGPLEFRLLCFFLKHRDRVFSRDELLSYVWGENVYLDERTVDVHIRRLRKQMSRGQHDDLIQTVHGSGYRFSEKKDDF